jgi:hypothetical protein
MKKINLSKKTISILLFDMIIFVMFVFAYFYNKNTTNLENWTVEKYQYPFFSFSDRDKTIYFYDGFPKKENLLEGNLSHDNNDIYFNTKKFNIKFKLFDFKLKINQCEVISYKRNRLEKKYFLCKKDVFFDSIVKDSIHKFCFKNYNLYNLKTGIVFFVCKKNGVLGHYFIDTSTSEETPLISEKKWGNVYCNRYDYSKFDTFSIK